VLPRLSSIVSWELKPCSTTSVVYLSLAGLILPFAGLQQPSRYTFAPFPICSATGKRLAEDDDAVPFRPSRRSPVFLSRHVSLVATLKCTMGRPSWVRLVSGSLPGCQPE
jgi:hypothetical protein